MSADQLDPTRPVTSWTAVAAVLGRSHDTVWRRRRAAGDKRRPDFRDHDEVWAWWRSLGAEPELAAPPPSPRRSPGGPRVLEGPLDPQARRRRLNERQ